MSIERPLYIYKYATATRAAQILRDHNKWRRDRSDDAPKGMPKSYNPELLGQAIDTAVKALEQPEPDELERFKAAVRIVYQTSCQVSVSHRKVRREIFFFLHLFL